MKKCNEKKCFLFGITIIFGIFLLYKNKRIGFKKIKIVIDCEKFFKMVKKTN